jgi:ABC-type branched-subunit amino acid transport system substrate-binding protein
MMERYATSTSVALAPDLNEDRLGTRSAHQKNREGRMQRLLCGFAGCALALLLGAAAADAQDTAKIGLIMPYSGQFADTATQLDNGIKL